MNKNPATSNLKPSGFRKFIYNTLLIIFIPGIILFLSEMILRLVNYGDNYHLFIDCPAEDFSQYKLINPDIGRKYFQKLDYNFPGGDMFLKEKPENGFRVFVMGSSSAIGFPYEQNLMFSRILQDRLQDCYSEKKVEVINTAITAINSFTLLDIVDDILKEEPDAILIYAGHNEFYGAYGVGSVEKMKRSRKLTLLHLNLLSLKLYQAVRNVLNMAGDTSSGDLLSEHKEGTLMKQIALNKEIAYKSSTYDTGLKYYRENLEELLSRINKKNIPVFISEICSNVKDLKPFCSIETGTYPMALEIFNNARLSEQEDNFEGAYELYNYARDLDCIRFRAPGEINDIIKEIANKYDANYVPLKADYFEVASPNRLIGNNLMTEHVHPNIEGYFMMADAFFNEMSASGVLGELNPLNYKSSGYYKKNWGYTELDSLVAVHVVSLLKTNWPFQSLESTSAEYRQHYIPTTFIDSLAFGIATTGNITIEDGHSVLAEVYVNEGDYYKAFKEYYANVKCDPFNVMHYNNAVHCLTFTNDFSLALKLISQSLDLKETFYANYIKGEILYLKGDYKDAINTMCRAAEFENSVEVRLQILISLHKLYYYIGNQAKATEVLAEIRKVNPDFQPDYSSGKKNYVSYIPVQVEDKVNKAVDLYQDRNPDKALNLFLKTLDIKETALANRYIGDILRTRNDSLALFYYRKAYPDYRNDTEFLFEMGILYLQHQKIDEAIKMLEGIKKLNPDFEKIPLLEKEINTRSSAAY